MELHLDSRLRGGVRQGHAIPKSPWSYRFKDGEGRMVEHGDVSAQFLADLADLLDKYDYEKTAALLRARNDKHQRELEELQANAIEQLTQARARLDEWRTT